MIEVQYQPQEHPYKLSHAILFYRNNQGTLATLHKIRNKQFMSGKSLDPAELEELLHTPNQQRHMNYLPAQVIAYSQNEILWFEKSAVRPIYFNVPKEEKERLFLNQLSGKKVIWPSLLFKISRNSISCWAVKSNRHPLPTTQLYFAPFTNLFSDQKFCLPNAVYSNSPDNLLKFATHAIDIIFQGHFSHLCGVKENTSYPGGRDRFWADMARQVEQNAIKSFPTKYLLPMNKTLENIL